MRITIKLIKEIKDKIEDKRYFMFMKYKHDILKISVISK